MARFEGLDRLGVLQGQADIVQTIEQAVLAEGIDLEAVLLAVRTGNGLRSQIDGQLVAFGRLGCWNSSSTSSFSTIGNRPFLKLLL